MRGYLRTLALFFVFAILIVGIGQIAGHYMGLDPTASLVLFLALGLLVNFVMYFWSAKMVLRTYRARIVTPQEAPRLHRIIDRVVLRSGVPKPTVAIIPGPTPNAFATGRNPKNAVVAATEGILHLLDDDELEGVLAHEISHVQNRDILIMTIASAFAMAISYMAWMFLFARNRDANPLLGLLLWILAPIAAMIIQLAISRSREFAADASGAKILGNGEPLARALMKLEAGVNAYPMRRGDPSTASMFIVNPFRGARLQSLFRSHPRTEARVERLRNQRL